MQTEIDPRNLIGHKAVDLNGVKVGTVDEVYLDDATGAPEWAALRTGMFGHDTLVPLSPSEFVEEELRVPFDKNMIKEAPDLGAGQHISPEQEMQLYRHYGLELGSTPRGPSAEDKEFGRVAGGETETSGTQEGMAISSQQGQTLEGQSTEQSVPTSSTEVGEPETDARTPVARPGEPGRGAAGTMGESAVYAGQPAATDNTEGAAMARGPEPMERTEQPRQASAVGTGAPMESQPIELTRHEEQLEVTTERRVSGHARVQRYVVTEDVERTVPVVREHARVVREPLSAEDAAALDSEEISEAAEEVELHSESPIVHKRMVPVERLRLVVEEVQGEETVREQVRKEHFDVADADNSASTQGPDQQAGSGGG